MGVVHVKPSVVLTGLQPAGVRILAAIDNCARVLQVDQTITSGMEGHGSTDPHTRGQALDVRAKDFTATVALRVYAYLLHSLGPQFTVLYECPEVPINPDLASIASVNPKASAVHFHIQLKRGTSLWPPDTLIA